MFGNHPLPNIALSFLCFLPPPTHHPPPPPSLLPLTSAHMGQVSVHSSIMPTLNHCTMSLAPTPITHHLLTSPCICPSPRQGIWANNTPHHCSNPPPHCSLPTATPTCHVAAERVHICHITAADDPHLPPHHPKPVCMPHHGHDDNPHMLCHSQQQPCPPHHHR